MKYVSLEIREDVYDKVIFFLKMLQGNGVNFLSTEDAKQNDMNTQKRFEAILNRYDHVRPFSQIDDPVTWQRELRNEWS